MALARRPAAPMADLLLGMSRGRKDADTKDGKASSSMVGDWLSTHPATPRRAELLKAEADASSCPR